MIFTLSIRSLRLWCPTISIIILLVLISASHLAGQPNAEDSRNQAADDATNPFAFVTKVQGQPNFTWKDDDARVIDLTSRIILPSASIGLPFIKSSDASSIYTVYRLEVPIIGQSYPSTPDADAVGLSDAIFVDVVVFKQSWGLLGVGPGFVIPAMKPEAISGGKWSVGPSGVLLNTKTKGLSWGLFVQQYFSFAGNDDRPKQNFMLFQPIINKLLGKGKFLSFSSTFKFNWENGDYDIPLGVNFGKAFAKNLSLLFGPEFVVSGPNRGDLTFRFQINAMFPPDQ